MTVMRLPRRWAAQTISTIAAALALALVLPACNSTHSAAEPAANGPREQAPVESAAPRTAVPRPEAIEVEGVRGLKQAGDIYIAGDATPAGAEQLMERGVKIIIDFRQPSQVPEGYVDAVRRMGLGYISIPMKSTELTPEQAEALLATMSEHAGKSMLLQCASGNRSGAMYGVYAFDQQDADAASAFEQARQAGMRNQQLAQDLRDYLNSRTGEK
jgi:uncharacterized protein (TIGR01244 family)